MSRRERVFVRTTRRGASARAREAGSEGGCQVSQSQAAMTMKSDRSSVWRLAQSLGRLELARGMPGQRLAAELALLKEKECAAFITLAEDHWMDSQSGV